MLWPVFALALMMCGGVYTQDCDLVWTVKINGKALLGGPRTVIPGLQKESQCIAACESYTDFTCLSIEYLKKSKKCTLKAMRKEDAPASQFKAKRSAIHRERTEVCAGCEWTWTAKTVGKYIKTKPNSRPAGKGTEQQCRDKCEGRGGTNFCTAINYNANKQKCFLLTVNKAFKNLKRSRHYVYSERELQCQLSNSCDPNPCQNGGACVRTDRGYSCRCANGYLGDNCETDRNDCSPNPCQNGGQCTDAVNDFTCTCVGQFTGGLCQTEILVDRCTPDPCQNGGLCINKRTDYLCKCPHGWGGRNCEYAPARCTIWGDPHYVTFDGLMYDFMGDDKYVLTRYMGEAPGLRQFVVLGKNEYRGNTAVSWQRYVDIKLDEHVVRLGPGTELRVDGVLKTSDVSYPTFIALNTGLKLHFETSYGLVVESDFQWTTTVEMPPQYHSVVEGLCGNYDGNPATDFIDSAGRDVTNLPDRYVELGMSWRVHDPDFPRPGERFTQIEDPCTDAMRTLTETNEYCGLLSDRSGPFAECIADDPAVSANSLDKCSFDICATPDFYAESLSQKQTACLALGSFATDCQKRGLWASWRVTANCPVTCPADARYVEIGPACPRSCTNPDAPAQCHLADTESCTCGRDKVLRDNVCVRPEECGCYNDQGQHFDIDDTWLGEDCVIYTCLTCEDCVLPVGKLMATSGGCAENAQCKYNEESQASACVVLFGDGLVDRSVEDLSRNAVIIIQRSRPIESDSRVTGASFYASRPGRMFIQVYRGEGGNNYSLVGEFQVEATNVGIHTVNLLPDQEFSVRAGDVFGLRFDGLTPIPFDYSTDRSSRLLITGDVGPKPVGSTLAFREIQTERTYSFQAFLVQLMD